MNPDDLTPEEFESLMQQYGQGTSNEDSARAVNLLAGMGNPMRDENFLHHQISTEALLEKLEHFYKGEYQGVNKDGELDWIKHTDKRLVTFNDFGVAAMMEIVSKYIDKNTTLSNYNSDRIYEILGDLGDTLIQFILCNYEEMGLDTPYKKSKFPVIVVTTLHMIESAYRRSLGGRTLEELNQSRVIGQFGKPMGPPPVPRGPSRVARFFGGFGPSR